MELAQKLSGVGCQPLHLPLSGELDRTRDALAGAISHIPGRIGAIHPSTMRRERRPDFIRRQRSGEPSCHRSNHGNLGKDLFRIDLGAVVSEYIGEREKNLRRVFRAAKDGHVVLFFDEADALFGKRTNVKNSHDRYANIEIDYLLRRSDKHADLTILATGNRAGTDKAFMRRFHIVIRIPERRKPRRKRFITC